MDFWKSWKNWNNKSKFKKEKIPEIKLSDKNIQEFIANSFSIKAEKVLDLSEKTAFLIYKDKNDIFDEKKLEIFTQNGMLIKNLKPKKINFPDNFTLQRNGGVKTIISYKEKRIALISSREKNCFFASLFLINDKKELFRSACLPEVAKNNDFNGLGSSNIHWKIKFYFL